MEKLLALIVALGLFVLSVWLFGLPDCSNDWIKYTKACTYDTWIKPALD